MKLGYGFNLDEFEKYAEFIERLAGVVASVREQVGVVEEGFENVIDELNETEAPRGNRVVAARRSLNESAETLVARADDLMIMFGLKGH